MFDYTNYTLTYILIVGIILFLVVMAIIYKRIPSQEVKTAIVLFSITAFICGGYGAIICKSKTDQRLQEIAESRQLFEAYSGPASIQYKNYPPIYINSNADVLNITVASLKENLDNTPEWLYKNATSITLTSQQYLIDNFGCDKNVMGYSSFPDMAVYTTAHATSSVLEHEFGHIYDYNSSITFDRNHQDMTPPDVLISNQNAVCEATDNPEYCMSSYHETFADAMALYVESPDKLPPDLKAWMDSLPK